jgi:hypothetical protein
MADYSYFNKADRINNEAHKIREHENHWFNGPIVLPVYMEPYYKSMIQEVNSKLCEAGLPPEKDWAYFGTPVPNAQLEDSAPPLKLSTLVTVLREGPI